MSSSRDQRIGDDDLPADRRPGADGPVPAGEWVLVIGGKADVVAKAKALGLRVLLFQDRSRVDQVQLALADHIVLTDLCRIADLIALARALRPAVPFTAVVSLYEDTLVAAAEIRAALNLPGVPAETVRLLKDKSAMRQRLAAIGISPVIATTGETLADVQAFLRRCRGPIVAKPADGSGSFGVFRIVDEATAEAAWEWLAGHGLAPFLMEEYLDGREVSVEAFSFGGHHVVISVTDKWVGLNYVEVGHTMPARLDPPQQAQVIEFTTAFLDAVGLADGPSHTEIKLTARGPRIVESHNRVGGDHINELVHTAFGIDLKQMALAWACGLREPLLAPPPAQGAAAIRFFTPPPGVVQSVTGLDEVVLAEGVVACELDLRPGDRVAPLLSSSDRPGFLMVRGHDAEEASDRADQLLRAVRIIGAC